MHNFFKQPGNSIICVFKESIVDIVNELERLRDEEINLQGIYATCIALTNHTKFIRRDLEVNTYHKIENTDAAVKNLLIHALGQDLHHTVQNLYNLTGRVFFIKLELTSETFVNKNKSTYLNTCRKTNVMMASAGMTNYFIFLSGLIIQFFCI